MLEVLCLLEVLCFLELLCLLEVLCFLEVLCLLEVLCFLEVRCLLEVPRLLGVLCLLELLCLLQALCLLEGFLSFIFDYLSWLALLLLKLLYFPEILRLLESFVPTAVLFMQVCHFSTNLRLYILSARILGQTLHVTTVISFTQIA